MSETAPDPPLTHSPMGHQIVSDSLGPVRAGMGATEAEGSGLGAMGKYRALKDPSREGALLIHSEGQSFI